MQNRVTKISKYLSLVLRHQPGKIGIALDAQGWVPVTDLLDALKAHHLPVTKEELDLVVAQNDKKRFAFSEDGLKIRASQGHSVEVDLGYEPAIPPDTLYHGTADRFMSSIRMHGLLKRTRQHVHLSADRETASRVGMRHGRVVILEVDSGRMHSDGHEFYLSANGVWLTDSVPPVYLRSD